jgi:uncharacterized protein with HEPN domain
VTQPEAAYLRDMLDAMEKVQRYLDGISYDEFAQNVEKQDAVEWNFTVMGEAAKQLTPELREENDDLPWKDMARMRDRIVHGYFSIDSEVLRKTAKERLPRATARLREALREIEDS